jgi:Zn-dependent M16 (insulinase) family peptidase
MNSRYGFDLIEERYLPELKTAGRLYRHAATGARLLSMSNDDENKVFSISFRTTPQDSTGVAHILEHAVLNGSEKYPLKEPFVELIKGSLKTFVNAMTYPDKTVYPVASQNLQDFYNLIDVYMDAVLHPLIPPHILDQEGWHYGLDEDGGELVFKGVVFNEMKGALSDPDDLLGEVIQQSLFPDNLYRFNSGGDPRNIPDLTYEAFKHFHQTYYHPSNAYIFWYGDDPEEARLQKTADYLAGYTALDVDSAIPLQPALEETIRVIEPYAANGEQEPRHYVALNWVLGEQNNPEEMYALSVLNHTLVGTQASPLRKALIDSGLGEDLVGGGMSSSLRQVTFATGLKGVREEDVGKVEDLILTTLQELAENGIDPNMLAASLNSVEFSLRENNTGPYPRGLLLMLRALHTWLYDGDPFAPLAYEASLTAIKQAAGSEPRFFESMIERYFLHNPHRSVVVLSPDSELNQRKEAEEKARLRAAGQNIGPEGMAGVRERAEKLKQIQETPDPPEALAALPTLTLADLDREIKPIPLEKQQIDGVPVLYHDLFTNGIVYLDLSFDLSGVPQELLPYLSLFAGGLVKMGTESEDYVRLSQRIGRYTGGVSPSLMLQHKFQSDDLVARLVVRSKAMVDKTAEMLAILREILLTADFDQPERFRQVLQERKARMESSLIPAGHAVVSRRLQASQSLAGWLEEQFHGLESLFFTRRLLEEIETDWPAVAARFRTLRDLIVRRGTLLLNVTLDRGNFSLVKPLLAEFAGAFPDRELPLAAWMPAAGPAREGLTIPAQVNYVGKGDNLYRLGYRPHGSINVIRKYLGTTYIWEKVRVQGGAYGGFISHDVFSGAFNFISYRDPNLNGTLANFDGTAGFLRRLALSDLELARAIIGTIGDLDAYQLPDAKGYSSMVHHLTGYSDAVRQQRRDEVLATSAADFTALAEVLEQVQTSGRVAVLGSSEAILRASQENGADFTMTAVL